MGKLTKRQYDLLVHEEARRNLPVGTYLLLLDQAAKTGKVPVLDPSGKPTGDFDTLPVEKRIDIAKYLIDKVLPDVPKEVYHIAQADPASDIPLERVTNASLADLTRIAAGTQFIEAEFDTNALKPEPD